jgi:hypothetical protein
VSRARSKGTGAETALVRWLQAEGWPAAERLPLQGRFDKGDVRWVPWLAVEVKNVRTPRYGEWLREAEAERVNLGADFGAVVHKPHGTGLGSAGQWHVVMTLEQFAALIREVPR